MTLEMFQKIIPALYPAYAEMRKTRGRMYNTKAAVGLSILHPESVRNARHLVYQGLVLLYRDKEAIERLERDGFVAMSADGQDPKRYRYAFFVRPHCDRDKMSRDVRCIWENIVAEVIAKLVVVELPSPIIWRHSGLGWLWQFVPCCDANKDDTTPWAARVCSCNHEPPLPPVDPFDTD